MFQKPALFATASLFFSILALPLHAASEGVQMIQTNDRVRVEINGQLFTEYIFQGASHTYYYPVLGPGGLRMSRDWPMKETEGEERDHKHHRSLWFSHGAVNGVDFWSEEAKAGKIVHDKFIEVKSGADSGVIKSRRKWVALDGQTMLTDENTFTVYNRPANERVFDYEIMLRAPSGREVVLGDTKEGTMAIRIAESMRLTHGKKPGAGHIVLSSGLRDDSTWGKPAEWCDYYGPVEGKIVGIAIFDHPQNPRHPTTWHVRDYGLFAANPFGLHDFAKQPPGTGNLTIPPGKTVTFRYRFYLHEGDDRQAKVAERFKEYTSEAK